VFNAVAYGDIGEVKRVVLCKVSNRIVKNYCQKSGDIARQAGSSDQGKKSAGAASSLSAVTVPA
jgi:hypothetical protein